ncbi:MAG TPA: hypothetical protein VHC68_02275 [Candidatus Paceibacterota bacterium]|nr:hypothetical protein [Candidatus Paceibacterota bacterium]
MRAFILPLALAAALAPHPLEATSHPSRARVLPALMLRSYFCENGVCFGHIRCTGVIPVSEDGSVSMYADLEVVFDDDEAAKLVITDNGHRVQYVDLYGNGTVDLVRNLDDLSQYRIVHGPSADVSKEDRAKIQMQYGIDETIVDHCLRAHLGPPPV